ncbi:MAG: hypothetical protein ABIG44_01135 [Planctomycetota bacterium]
MSTAAAGTLPARLSTRIFTPLARLRRRCRLYLHLEGVRILLIVMVGLSGLQLVLDRWLRMTTGQRLLLSLCLLLVWLWILYRRVWRPLRCPLPDDMLAALVDRKYPELADRFTTAVQFAGGARGRASPRLVQAVLTEACDSASVVSFLTVLNHRRARKRARDILIMLVALMLVGWLMPVGAGTWFQRNWLLSAVNWPQHTHIWPEGFDQAGRRRMARGDMVEISAMVIGAMPTRATLQWWTPAGNRGHETMSQVGERGLVVAIGQLAEDIHFRIVGGDERTREYVIEAVERPRIMHTVARVQPPAYTRMAPIELEQQTVLEVLFGATLEIQADLNKPVEHAAFVATDGTPAPCVVLPGVDAERGPFALVYWPEPVSGSYSFELRDQDGLRNRDPVRYTLRVVADRAPQVRMELTDVGEMVTPTAELPIDLLVDDSYGLAAVRVIVQAAEQAERTVAVPDFSAGSRRFSIEFGLAVAATGVSPGDRLRVWAEADDLDPRGPNVGTAPVTTLRVVSRDEFLAEMARQELVLRQEFERLASAQRKLSDALQRILEGVEDGQPLETALDRRLAGLGRSQAAQAARCLALGRGFARVLAQMRTSHVARPEDEQRIKERVIIPLGQLAQEAIPAASRTLDALRAGVEPRSRAEATLSQEEVLRRMQDILANMLEWEGYQQALTLLEEVIDAQATIRAETLNELGEQLDDILDLGDLDDGQESVP